MRIHLLIAEHPPAESAEMGKAVIRSPRRSRAVTKAVVFFCLLFGVTQVWAAALTVGNIEAAPGAQISLPIEIQAAAGEKVVGLQFDLDFSNIAVVDLPPEKTINADLTVREDHSIRYLNLGNNKMIVVVYSPTNQPLNADTTRKTLFSLPLGIKSTASVSSSTLISVSNPLAVSFSSAGRSVSPVPLDGASGTGSVLVVQGEASLDLSFDRTPGSGAVLPGSRIDYILNISNATETLASAFEIKLDLNGIGAQLVPGTLQTTGNVGADAISGVIEARVTQLTGPSTIEFALEVDNPFSLTTPVITVKALALPDTSGSNITRQELEDSVDVEVFSDVRAELRHELLIDNDNDGLPNPSDVIRYTLRLINNGNTNVGPAEVLQQLPTGTAFVQGSVLKLDSDIVFVNESTPEALKITLDTIFGGSAGIDTLTYDVLIQDNPPPSGPVSLQNRIEINGVQLLSDDPTTSGKDATTTPVGPVARLEAPEDEALGGEFGHSTAIAGDFVAVGSPMEGNGMVRVFEIQADGNRKLIQTLSGDEFGANLEFGFSVTLSEDGEYLAIGAPGAQPPGAKGNSPPSKAVVLRRLGSGQNLYSRVAQNLSGSDLAGDDPQADDRFGTAITLDTDGNGNAMLVVGAPDDDELASQNGSGAVYVYPLANGVAEPPLKLVPPVGPTSTTAQTVAPRQFGASLASKAGKLAVGAPGSTVGSAVMGAAALYENISENLGNSGAMPMPMDVLTSDGGSEGDEFGDSIALDGDALIIGAPGEDDGANQDVGAVYAFAPAGTTFNRIKPPLPDRVPNARYGDALAISINSLLVGARGVNAAKPSAGAVFRYNRGASAKGAAPSFDFVQKVGAFAEQSSRPGANVPDQKADQSGFGASVAISEGRFVVGAPTSEGSLGSAAVRLTGDAEFRSSVIFQNGFEETAQ